MLNMGNQNLKKPLKARKGKEKLEIQENTTTGYHMARVTYCHLTLRFVAT